MSNMMDMKRAHAAKSSFCAESPSTGHRQQFCKLLSYSFPVGLVHIVYSYLPLPRLALVRHRGATLPSGSSSSASRPNRRKSVYLAPKACCAALKSDSRKSLKPKLASWVAAMVAMVSDLDGRSGHDQGSRWERSRQVVEYARAQARRCGHGFAGQSRGGPAVRYGLLVARHGRRVWLAMGDEDGQSCDCAKAARTILVADWMYLGTMPCRQPGYQTRSDGQDLAGRSKPCNWRWLLVDSLAANAPSAEI